MKRRNKKITIVIFVIILILIIGGFVGYKIYKDKQHKKQFTFATQEEKAKSYEQYLAEGLKYKSEGDQGNKDAYYKAIDAYLNASEVGEGKVWVPYLNVANMYKMLKDNKNADKYYDKALAINPAEPLIYMAKIELYKYDPEKKQEEVLAVYKKALDDVTENANIVVDYASYLESIGKNDEALKYFNMLLEKYPDNQVYKDEIKILKEKLGIK